MKTVFIIPIILLLSCFTTVYSITDGDFFYGELYWKTYASYDSSVAFYPDPFPDPFVRILAHGSQGYAGIYQKETGQATGNTRAIFYLKTISAGLGGEITVGWTNQQGSFSNYYVVAKNPGTFTVDCSDTSYPYVTVQADSTYIVNAIVEVDKIEVINPSATPTPTATPVPTPTQAPPPISLITNTCNFLNGKGDLSPQEQAQADYNQDSKIDIADIVKMINALH